MMDQSAAAQDGPSGTKDRSSLREVTLLFLRLGCTAFGGPAAHVSIMEDELVRRRRWLTREQFLDLLGAVNLIPGPNSTEMAIHIGYLRAGWPGLLAAGCAFILPAAVLVTGIAWAYDRFGGLPEFTGLLYGMKPVVIAVIAQALWRLARTAVRTPLLAGVGVAVAVAGLCQVDALMLLLGGGAAMGLVRGLRPELGHAAGDERPGRPRSGPDLRGVLVMLLVAGGILAAAQLVTRLGDSASGEFSFAALLLYFLKIGAVMYGTGYVLLAFLQTDLVERWRWVTLDQLLDATAVGQVTPGPLFTTATFIGYLTGKAAVGSVAGGLAGAAVATVGIFLPAFVLVAWSGALVPRLRKSLVAGAFLDGVNVAALALMGVITWHLGRVAVLDLTTAILALASLVVLVRFRLSSAWLVLAGAAIGVGLHLAGFVQ